MTDRRTDLGAYADLDHGTYRCEGERIVARLDALAEEVWALAENPPADRDAANAWDRQIEDEWRGGVGTDDEKWGVR